MPNLSNISTIKDILARHRFSFSKSLGQNFLINPGICGKIAELGNAREGFGILEIGPGIGVLTAELCKRADKVVAVEIDKRLIPILEETMSEFDNFKVVNEDILKVDIKRLIQEEFGDMPVAVCANLPYYITSPIIMMLLESRVPIKSITVMVQKEAAARICANLGTREAGAVSVAVRYFSTPRLLFNVSRGSFIPAPNVDSSVIRLDIRENTPTGVINEEFFFKTVKSAFSMRRKNIANSISSGLGTDKETVLSAADKCGISPSARAEQLTMKQFIALGNELYLKLSQK